MNLNFVPPKVLWKACECLQESHARLALSTHSIITLINNLLKAMSKHLQQSTNPLSFSAVLPINLNFQFHAKIFLLAMVTRDNNLRLMPTSVLLKRVWNEVWLNNHGASMWRWFIASGFRAHAIFLRILALKMMTKLGLAQLTAKLGHIKFTAPNKPMWILICASITKSSIEILNLNFTNKIWSQKISVNLKTFLGH